jgi:hypothetical protein
MHGNTIPPHRCAQRRELGFQGFLVSDWAAIDQIAPDYKDRHRQLHQCRPGHDHDSQRPLTRRITTWNSSRTSRSWSPRGKVPPARIDDAVTRILRIKYQMGLFENPWTDPALTAKIGSPEHRQVARQCVRESLVLLKNERHALPLAKDVKHIFVVWAEAADDLGRQCGGWTITWQGNSGETTRGGTTLLSAIRKAVSPGTEVTYSPDGSQVTNARMPSSWSSANCLTPNSWGIAPTWTSAPATRRSWKKPKRPALPSSLFYSPAALWSSARARLQRRLPRRLAARHRRFGCGRRALRRRQTHRQTAPRMAA